MGINQSIKTKLAHFLFGDVASSPVKQERHNRMALKGSDTLRGEEIEQADKERERADAANLAILLEEYKSGRQEIMARLGWQQQIIGLGTAGLAGHLAAAAALTSRNNPVLVADLTPWIFTSASLLASCIGLLLSREDYMIIQIAFFQNSVLAPALSKIAGTERLTWDRFRSPEGMGQEAFKVAEWFRRRLSKVPHGYLQGIALACGVGGLLNGTYRYVYHLQLFKINLLAIEHTSLRSISKMLPFFLSEVAAVIVLIVFWRYSVLRERTKTLYTRLWRGSLTIGSQDKVA